MYMVVTVGRTKKTENKGHRGLSTDSSFHQGQKTQCSRCAWEDKISRGTNKKKEPFPGVTYPCTKSRKGFALYVHTWGYIRVGTSE